LALVNLSWSGPHEIIRVGFDVVSRSFGVVRHSDEMKNMRDVENGLVKRRERAVGLLRSWATLYLLNILELGTLVPQHIPFWQPRRTTKKDKCGDYQTHLVFANVKNGERL
jgi:hypothetical protein